jgi:hypothetical protein
MRNMIAALAGLITLSAVSAEAAPQLSAKAGFETFSARPQIELAADGCGSGYWRTRWQDQWGYWHWGRCVPKWWGKGAFLPPEEPDMSNDWYSGMRHR